VGIVIDEENIARAFDAARRLDGAMHGVHGRVEHFDIGDALHFHVAKLAEGPAGVVVDALLGIVGGPVLIVEQGVGDAAVGLIHAHHIAARGVGVGLELGFFGGLGGGRSVLRRIVLGCGTRGVGRAGASGIGFIGGSAAAAAAAAARRRLLGGDH